MYQVIIEKYIFANGFIDSLVLTDKKGGCKKQIGNKKKRKGNCRTKWRLSAG